MTLRSSTWKKTIVQVQLINTRARRKSACARRIDGTRSFRPELNRFTSTTSDPTKWTHRQHRFKRSRKSRHIDHCTDPPRSHEAVVIPRWGPGLSAGTLFSLAAFVGSTRQDLHCRHSRSCPTTQNRLMGCKRLRMSSYRIGHSSLTESSVWA